MIQGQKLEIEYPTRWKYTLFSQHEDSIRAVVDQHLSHKETRLSFSKSSSKGKYVSMTLEVRVDSEKERLAFYRALRAEAAIVMIL